METEATHDFLGQIERLQKRLERERKARAEAEAIAEQGLRNLYKKQQEIELLQTVASAANEAVTFAEALQTTLKCVCLYTGWAVGHVYLPDPSLPCELISTELWHFTIPERYQLFREATASTRLAKGIGLPGQVLAAGTPVWMPDVTQADSFPRAFAAHQQGLRAGFAFGVALEEEVVAVLEFFSHEIVAIDEALVAVMGHISSQLSRIVERERATERIHYLAYHDTLTESPNRRLLKDRLDVSLEQAQCYTRQLGILFLDLDRFKVVNDSLGHKSGDQLLEQVALRLKQCVRKGDTIARSGGDEFVVLLPEVANDAEVDCIAARILAVMQPSFLLEGQEVYVTFSIGGSTFPLGGHHAEVLLKNADIALYKAKQNGRNCYELFTTEMASQAQETLQLETSMRKALVNKEFAVHYQPQVAIGTGRIIGMEALVRWNHPQLGTISPAHFIPLAEETGLIVPLGMWVLETACWQLKAWQDAGAEHLRLSVNLSLRQFQQPDLVSSITAILKQTGIPPNTLDLEITESIAVKDMQNTQVVMQSLKGLGVRLSLDDFGTGYSSLSSLSLLPMDTVKIDQSFIKSMLVDPRNAAIAKSIIQMSRSLNMHIVAEGVETPQQLQFLADCDCDTMQGYLFSKPLQAEDFTRLLSEQSEQSKQTQQKAA